MLQRNVLSGSNRSCEENVPRVWCAPVWDRYLFHGVIDGDGPLLLQGVQARQYALYAVLSVVVVIDVVVTVSIPPIARCCPAIGLRRVDVVLGRCALVKRRRVIYGELGVNVLSCRE